jgi:hypothetical protein
MKTDRELDEILAEIGREHRAMDAPERLESVLLGAVGGRRGAAGKPRMRFVWAMAAVVALLAVVVSGGVLWQTRRNAQPQAQQARSVVAPRIGPESKALSRQDSGRRDASSKAAPVRRVGAARVSRRDASPQQSSWNSLDEFVALPASEGLPVAEELSVVRMRLRGSDLQQYGLQAPADGAAQTLLAEFVVGEDGLPRAIRIVR